MASFRHCLALRTPWRHTDMGHQRSMHKHSTPPHNLHNTALHKSAQRHHSTAQQSTRRPAHACTEQHSTERRQHKPRHCSSSAACNGLPPLPACRAHASTSSGWPAAPALLNHCNTAESFAASIMPPVAACSLTSGQAGPGSSHRAWFSALSCHDFALLHLCGLPSHTYFFLCPKMN